MTHVKVSRYGRVSLVGVIGAMVITSANVPISSAEPRVQGAGGDAIS